MVTFRFYEELNDFLPPERKKKSFTFNINNRNSIKDVIESIGVPHTEVDLILVNGESMDFSYIVQADDRISVYPVFESIDISPLNRLRPAPLRTNRFILDAHLGKLARYLRLLGFDSLYQNNYTDQELADVSSMGDKRILLTRDQGLLKRRQVTHGYFIRETIPKKQVKEVLKRFDLYRSVNPFERCIHCNEKLQVTDKGSVVNQITERIREQFNNFSLCAGCQRVYWQGSHYDHLQNLVNGFLSQE